MSIIPTLRCRSMQKSLAFYTSILDFERVDGDDGLDDPFFGVLSHEGPIDPSWGTREFYVDDPDGNTLRFTQA